MTEALDLATWAERAAEVAPATADGSAFVVNLNVTGGPGGDFDTVWRVGTESVAVEPGSAPDADVNVTAKYKDFAAVVQGELPPPVAYMQGKLKPAGDMNLILRLLALSSTEAFDRWRLAAL